MTEQYTSHIKCPACGSRKSKCLDSRGVPGGTHIRRRKICLTCKNKFSTSEILMQNGVRTKPLKNEVLELMLHLEKMASILTEIKHS